MSVGSGGGVLVLMVTVDPLEIAGTASPAPEAATGLTIETADEVLVVEAEIVRFTFASTPLGTVLVSIPETRQTYRPAVAVLHDRVLFTELPAEPSATVVPLKSDGE